MTETTIKPLDSMRGEEPLDLSEFLPPDVAAIVAASMQKMRGIAQKAEDGDPLSAEEQRDYAVHSSLVQNTMLDYLRSDRCGIPSGKARDKLIADGEELRSGPLAKLVQAMGRMAGNDGD